MGTHLRHLVPLILLTLGVYSGVVRHDFVDYDDPRYVTENPNLATGLGWDGIVQDFTEPYFGNWIPLSHLSLRIDHALYGLDPTGFLLTNLALHVLATLLLYAAFTRLTGAAGPSAFVAGLFALHPLHVESVAWVSERKDVLSGAFFAATLLAYAYYAERAGSHFRYALVAICLALGLLAKPMLVTLPFVLLLLDFWPLGRLRETTDRRVLWEKLPLLALVSLSCWVTFSVQQTAGAMFTVEHLSLAARVANALRSYAVYVLQTLWPIGLAPFYPLPLSGHPGWQIAASGLFVAIATAAALRLAHRLPYVAVGWLWYLGMLVPVIGLVQVGMQAHADRFTYLPQIGLALAIAWGARDAAAAWKLPARALWPAAAIVLLACAALTWRQVQFWENAIRIHERIVQVNPRSHQSHHRLAAAYRADGRLDEAHEHYARARELRPEWGKPYVGLADVAMERDELDLALPLYESGLRRDTSHASGHTNYGTALIRAGRPIEAEEMFRRALEVLDSEADYPRPGLEAQARFGLGDALWARGDRAAARAEFYSGLRLDPEHAAGHVSLALLALELGDAQSARASLGRARALEDDSARLHLAEALLAEASGDPVRAAEAYRSALARNERLLVAQNNLAWLLATKRVSGAPEEAVRLAESAVAVSRRQQPAFLDTLAAAEAASGRFERAVAIVDEALALPGVADQKGFAEELRAHRARYAGGRTLEP